MRDIVEKTLGAEEGEAAGKKMWPDMDVHGGDDHL